MELKALLGSNLVGNINGRLATRFATAHVRNNVVSDVIIKLRPVGTLSTGRAIGQLAPILRTLSRIELGPIKDGIVEVSRLWHFRGTIVGVQIEHSRRSSRGTGKAKWIGFPGNLCS